MKWKTVKIGDVCQIVSGTTPSTNVAEYWGGEFKWIAPAEIEEDSKFIVTTQKTITQKAVNETSMRLLPVGTVLLSSRAPIGKVAIAATEMYCNQGFKNLICSDEVHNEFLFWFLKGKKEFLNSLGRGATFKEISKSIVASVEIPLPPLAEQRRIAAILDNADAIRRKRQQSLELADSLLKSVFLDMFGDPVTNPKGLRRKYLNDLCISIVDCVNKTAPTVETATEYKMIRTSNVKNKSISVSNVKYVLEDVFTKWTRREVPREGDVILTREAPMGEVGLIPPGGNYFLGQRLVSYRCDKTKLSPYYLLHYMGHYDFLKQVNDVGVGSTVKHIPVPACSKFTVLYPPISLQNEFATIVQRMEANKKRFLLQNFHFDHAFKSLQQSFFG